MLDSISDYTTFLSTVSIINSVEILFLAIMLVYFTITVI